MEQPLSLSLCPSQPVPETDRLSSAPAPCQCTSLGYCSEKTSPHSWKALVTKYCLYHLPASHQGAGCARERRERSVCVRVHEGMCECVCMCVYDFVVTVLVEWCAGQMEGTAGAETGMCGPMNHSSAERETDNKRKWEREKKEKKPEEDNGKVCYLSHWVTVRHVSRSAATTTERQRDLWPVCHKKRATSKYNQYLFIFPFVL